ncbi:MAG TPA: TetR/AcrR family transcriptional regulator, partial [Candidatus Phocaeicola gallinarum]|nr:TetR/AcrR family transcriptional regulator [Candidatus Phocaeicola gallinarum]
GMEQGIFRDDINFRIINEAMLMSMDLLIYSDIIEDYSLSEIYSEVTFLHIRGIATEKGMKMVDAFLEEIKKGKQPLSR